MLFPKIVLFFISIINYNIDLSICFSCDELGELFDLSNISKPIFWNLNGQECVDTTEANCELFFMFCKTLPPYGNCSDSSVCQFDNNPDHPIVQLAKSNASPWTIKDDFNGYYATFSGVEIINKYTQKPCNLTVLIELDCDKNAFWNSSEPSDGALAPNPVAYTGIATDNCQVYYKFSYAGACHRIIIPTTTDYNPPPSKICIPPKGYDISPLTSPPYWSFNITSGCGIVNEKLDKCFLLASFCKPLDEDILGCGGASACIRYPNNPQSTLIVGNYSEDPFTAFEKDLFSADYPNGAQIMNRFTNQSCNVDISIFFECDLGTVWPEPPTNEPGLVPSILGFASISNISCQINVTVPYSGACSKTSANTNLSGGSILLIIVFIGAFIYLLVGSTYNTIVEKQSGLRVIPNYEFWSSSILFSLDGFIFAWRFLTCQSKKDKLISKYDSI